MFGSSSNKSSLFGSNDNSSTESILPSFQDDSAFSKICPNLTYKQRIIGFLTCASVGYVISFIGPKSQCKKMWDASRRFSTAFYLSMIIIVFAVAVTKQNIFLIIFLLIVEILAGTWYSLSFIPFGRKIVLTFLRSTGCCFPCFAASDAVHDFMNSKKSSSSSSSSSSTSKSSTPTFSSMFK
eukprot:gene18055-23701_t